jgi:hypothetical protein
MRRARRRQRHLSLLIVVASLAGACTDGDASPDRTPETAISPPETPSPSASPAPATEPDARGYALMTDVPGDLGVVVFGGFDGPECCELADMWSYRPGRDWTELTPDSLPGIGFEFAFDAASDRLVLAEPEGETWAYDPAATTWEAKTEVGPPVWGSAMAYDAQSDRMILVGEDQTWAYDLDRDTWEQMEPGRTPPYREFGKVAYDTDSDRVILFGGNSGTIGEPLGDTWSYDYDSDTWTEMSPDASPPARSYAALAYDPATDRVLLFGGSVDEETAEFDDTWAYDVDRDAWTQIETAGPTARAWHTMAADDETGLVVLFGGGVTRDDYTNEVWIFDPSTEMWSQAS